MHRLALPLRSVGTNVPNRLEVNGKIFIPPVAVEFDPVSELVERVVGNATE